MIDYTTTKLHARPLKLQILISKLYQFNQDLKPGPGPQPVRSLTLPAYLDGATREQEFSAASKSCGVREDLGAREAWLGSLALTHVAV